MLTRVINIRIVNKTLAPAHLYQILRIEVAYCMHGNNMPIQRLYFERHICEAVDGLRNNLLKSVPLIGLQFLQRHGVQTFVLQRRQQVLHHHSL